MDTLVEKICVHEESGLYFDEMMSITQILNTPVMEVYYFLEAGKASLFDIFKIFILKLYSQNIKKK